MKYIDDPDFDPKEVLGKIEQLRERYGITPTLTGRVLFRPKPLLPSRLFKYTSVATARDHILTDLKLRYTQSELLDDVFEEAPCREEIARLMPEFEDGPTLVVDVADPDERLAVFDRVRDVRARMRKADIVLSDDVAVITSNGLDREWKYELGNRPLKYALEEMRKPLALSLTELNNSVKMWAAYADNHHGLCLEFNTRNKYFRSNRDNIGQSGYVAPIEYRDLTVEDYAYRFPHERFFIKMPEWAEQHEWRRIEFADPELNIASNGIVYTFPFPPRILTSIVFGARCSEQDAKFIVRLVRSQPKLSHVQFVQARRSVGQLILERYENVTGG
jgi:hypothetical protein